MENLIELIQKAAKVDSPRYRDSRGHSASSALTCLRDQYWKLTGEPETDPTDFVGSMKMLVGKCVEDGLVKELLAKLCYWGTMLRGTQVQVGGSNPAWNGFLDALLWSKDGGHYVVEIKTKSGYGADLLYDKLDVSKEYLVQLGLYLKDLHGKGVTKEGCLLYALLSDRHFGTLLQIFCRYEPETDSVRAYRAKSSDGLNTAISINTRLSEISKRWEYLNLRVQARECPKGEYQYKYSLTEELLKEQSDDKVRKMAAGVVVLGDWNVKYSRYKTKQLQVDKVEPGYTEAEIAMIKQHYRRRHPRSKI